MTGSCQEVLSVASPARASQPTCVRASLRLRFERRASDGVTSLMEIAQQPPLRVVRAFRAGDDSALAHLHNVSGGVLAGDQLSFSVDVGAGANVQLTTTGATRVYRCREGAIPSAQLNEFVLKENALLEYVPDATIPFAGARFRQQTKIELGLGAGLFWWEILAPGREARGERFAYSDVELKTEISAEGKPIALENVLLAPRQTQINSVARLGSYRYWTTFYICQVGRDARSWVTAEHRLREVSLPWCRPGEMLWSFSTLAAHGLIVRGLARTGAHILPALQAIWSSAKSFLFGRLPIFPRKVY